MRLSELALRESYVPAGLRPKNLLNIYIHKAVTASIGLALDPSDNALVLAHKVVDMIDMLAAIRDSVPESEIVEALGGSIELLDAQIEAIHEQRGKDWDPVYSLDMPIDELTDAFLLMSRHDLDNIRTRIQLDDWEASL